MCDSVIILSCDGKCSAVIDPSTSLVRCVYDPKTKTVTPCESGPWYMAVPHSPSKRTDELWEDEVDTLIEKIRPLVSDTVYKYITSKTMKWEDLYVIYESHRPSESDKQSRINKFLEDFYSLAGTKKEELKEKIGQLMECCSCFLSKSIHEKISKQEIQMHVIDYIIDAFLKSTISDIHSVLKRLNIDSSCDISNIIDMLGFGKKDEKESDLLKKFSGLFGKTEKKESTDSLTKIISDFIGPIKIENTEDGTTNEINILDMMENIKSLFSGKCTADPATEELKSDTVFIEKLRKMNTPESKKLLQELGLSE